MPAYTLEGAQWPDTHITWSFATSNYIVDASGVFSNQISGEYQGVIQSAFQQWAAVSPLTFTQVADGGDYYTAANIRVGFGMLNTPSTGVIGQTSLRWNGSGNLIPDEIVRLEDPNQLGLVQGNSGYTYSGTATTLQQVAMHEIGHALGLGHASDPNAIMYGSVGPNNQTINSTDIAGIQSLYGAPASAPAQAPVAQNSPIDMVTLYLSEDSWYGDAQFVVSVDGRQLGGAQSVTASHGSGQNQAFNFQGSFGAGAHDVAISFFNDAWGGTPDTDRNLYVDRIDFNGAALASGSAALYSNGTAHFPAGSGSRNAELIAGGDTDNTMLASFPVLT